MVDKDATIEVPSVGGRPPRVLARQILCEILEPRVEEILGLVQREIERCGFQELIGGGVVITWGATLHTRAAFIAPPGMGCYARRRMSLRPHAGHAALLALPALAILCVGTPALAQRIRSYRDAHGVVHLSNGGTRHRSPGQGHAVGLQVPMPLLEAVIAESATQYNIPPELVKAVIATESNYNPWAVSARGAIGLMQLMPETAREMYVDDPFDPVQNIEGGVRYLRVLVNRFDGDLLQVLAAYNAGPELVSRNLQRGNGGVPAIAETQDYVRRVLRSYQAFKGTAERS